MPKGHDSNFHLDMKATIEHHSVPLSPLNFANKVGTPHTGMKSGLTTIPQGNESAMRETTMSHNSHMSTATDRLKRMLKNQPVHIKGAGFLETPYQRLLIEE